MPKFVKGIEELGDSLFDKWMFVIKNLPMLDAYPQKIRERLIEEFFRQAEIMAFSREERMAYEISLKNKWDYDNILRTHVEDAQEKGREQGILEGKLEIARSMLESRMQPADVCRITGLSKEELSNL